MKRHPLDRWLKAIVSVAVWVTLAACVVGAVGFYTGLWDRVR